MKFLKIVQTSLLGGGTVPDTSDKFEVNKTDWAKILVHCLIVGGSASIVALAEYASKIDVGEYNLFVVPVVSAVVLYVQKWLKNNDPINEVK